MRNNLNVTLDDCLDSTKSIVVIRMVVSAIDSPGRKHNQNINMKAQHYLFRKAIETRIKS